MTYGSQTAVLSCGKTTEVVEPLWPVLRDVPDVVDRIVDHVPDDGLDRERRTITTPARALPVRIRQLLQFERETFPGSFQVCDHPGRVLGAASMHSRSAG